MRIRLEKVAKRYRYEWILRRVNLELDTSQQHALLGPNGSGKSTLLKIISGHLSPSKGKVEFFDEAGKTIEIDQFYRHLSYSAPYIDLIEEFTLEEIVQFHQKFQPFQEGLDLGALLDLLHFPKAKKKEVRFFSSGMKQRLKLLLSICSNSQVLLLDEPTSNLDHQGIDWYRQLIDTYAKNRLLIIASNAPVDYDFCENQISVLSFKTKEARD